MTGGPSAVVNVSTVPQRSPFRYPGGKTWLVPHVRQWLCRHRASVLVEPFAGGGIVGLTAVFENLVDHAVLVEIDEHVAAVWSTILGGGAERLAERILAFKLSVESVQDLLARVPCDTGEKAFHTIVRNRAHHGGILAPGSSLTRQGENGTGIGQRWYAETLARRVMAIAGRRDKFTFIQGDGIEVMESRATNPQTLLFVDPPYTAGVEGKRAGSRLYLHHELDHDRLFAVASRLVGDVLLTYDDTLKVRQLADRHGFQVERLRMQNTHNTKLTELVIGRDLSWMRSAVTQQELPYV